MNFTKAEINYMWMLTAMDAMRLGSMDDSDYKDYSYKIRHSIRTKLMEAMDAYEKSDVDRRIAIRIEEDDKAGIEAYSNPGG